MMIVMEYIAQRVVERLLKYKLIEEENRELYCYSFQVVIERLIGFSALFFLSVLFKRTIETIVFVVFFSAIRRRSGGFHARTYLLCFFGSIGLYSIYVLILFSWLEKNMFINSLITIVSAMILLVIGAVNHPNMAWNEEEFKKSKSIARWVVITELVCIIAGLGFGLPNKYILFMSFGIILSAVLLIAGKLIKQEV